MCGTVCLGWVQWTPAGCHNLTLTIKLLPSKNTINTTQFCINFFNCRQSQASSSSLLPVFTFTVCYAKLISCWLWLFHGPTGESHRSTLTLSKENKCVFSKWESIPLNGICRIFTKCSFECEEILLRCLYSKYVLKEKTVLLCLLYLLLHIPPPTPQNKSVSLLIHLVWRHESK